MKIEVRGIDYRNSTPGQRRKVYLGLAQANNILVTCNRLESYGYQDKALFNPGYYYKGERQVRGHLLALACGLRSQLLGERQIMDQLERFSRQTDAYLSGLIGQSLCEARLLRKELSLNSDFTVADAVFNHVSKQRRLGSKVVVVGTGVVSCLIAKRFSGFFRLCFVSGKNIDVARRLARQYQAEAFERKDFSIALEGAEVLISATDSPHYVITPEHGVSGCLVYDLSSWQDNVHPSLNAIGLTGLSREFDCLNQELKERVICADKIISEEYLI